MRRVADSPRSLRSLFRRAPRYEVRGGDGETRTVTFQQLDRILRGRAFPADFWACVRGADREFVEGAVEVRIAWPSARVVGRDLRIGSRVKVIQDAELGPGPWPAEPLGRIGTWAGGSPSVVVDTRDGPALEWWVTFDAAQFDADGDGPYETARILDCYLLELG